MNNKVLSFIVQVVVTAVVFTFLVWLFGYIFDHVSTFDWGLLFQGAVFAIIYVPFSNWIASRRKKRQ